MSSTSLNSEVTTIIIISVPADSIQYYSRDVHGGSNLASTHLQPDFSTRSQLFSTGVLRCKTSQAPTATQFVCNLFSTEIYSSLMPEPVENPLPTVNNDLGVGNAIVKGKPKPST